MQFPIRYSLMALMFPMLANCGAIETETQADMACQTAVELALPLLDTGHIGDITRIEPGLSGQAVSCAVTGTQGQVMVDATASCPGQSSDLAACIRIDGIHAMDGRKLYP